MSTGAVRQQYRHNHIQPEALAWFERHFPPSTFHGRIQIGRRKNDGFGLQKLFLGEREQVQEFLQEMHASPHLDYYIMANTICGVSRKAEGLFTLQNIVIDIDCHNTEVSPWERDDIFEKLSWRLAEEKDTDIPSPTSIVWTGRGLQLWWAIRPVHIKCKPYFDSVREYYLTAVQRILEEETEGMDDAISVDAASSRNAVGYFRLPGTFNTATGTLVKVIECKGETHYILQDLVEQVKKAREESANAVKQKAIINKAPEAAEDFSGRYLQSDIYILRNFHTFGFFRMRQLIQLRILRNERIGEETRNNFCFMAYNAMLPALGHDKAWDKLVAFNEGFKEPLTEKQLAGVICTAEKKNGYRYSNEKMIEFLDISPEEQKAIGLYSPVAPFNPMVRVSGNPSRQQSRRLIKEDRDRKVVQMLLEGKTGKQIAQELEICADTVTKIKREHRAEIQNAKEQRILKLVREGKSQTEIAATLGCSQKTVQRLYAKIVDGQKSYKCLYI